MIERGQYLSFALKTGHSIRIAGNARRQHLEGHLPLQPGIGGTVDFAHSAGANRVEDFVGTEPRAWDERRRHVGTRSL
jgi:hypothetical protein